MNYTLLIIDFVLIIFPISYMLFTNIESIKENRMLFHFLLSYLIGISSWYIFQSIGGLYLGWIKDNLLITFGMIFFFISIICMIRLYIEHLDSRIYYLCLILLIFTLFLSVFSAFYTPSERTKITPRDTTLAFFLLLGSVCISLGTGFVYIRFMKKREFKYDISTKDLRYIIYFLLGGLGVFFVISLIQLSFKGRYMYSGFVEFDDMGDKIFGIMGSIIYEPFFMLTSIFCMFGAVVRVIGIGATKLFGNIIMAFLPMLLWLQYFFGDVPKDIVQMFEGMEWFAKIFYMVLTTMLLITVISAFNIFTSIIMMTS